MHTPITSFSDGNIPNSILLADPSLRDGYFDRSVIYMTEHEENHGSLGIILNKPTPRKLGEIISSDQYKGLAHLPIYMGGPVDTDQMLFASFEWTEPNTLSCDFKISADQALELLEAPHVHVRAFVGHAAWTAGQLKDEVGKHAWFCRDAPARIVLETKADSLWQSLLQDISPFHHIISLTPENPFLN